MENDGVPEGYTRVSEILGQWTFYDGTNTEARDRGSRVHMAVQAFYQRDQEIPLPEEDRGFFESFQSFVEQRKCKIISQEQRLNCSNLMLSGKIDMFVQYPESDGLVVADIKCSSSPFHAYWKLQGTLYCILAGINGIETAPYFDFLQLDRTGKLPKVHRYEYTTEMRKLAMCAVSTYRHFEEDLRKKKEKDSRKNREFV